MDTEKRKRKGKHPERALSATRIRTLVKPGRYVDGNGLCLVVKPSGSKQWVLRTKIRGKRCDEGLGGVSLVSLAQAREEAVRLRKIVRSGTVAERRLQRRTVSTFKGAALE